MIRGGEDGGDRAIFVERGIHGAIGEEACEGEVSGEAEGGSSPLQVVGGAGGVGPEGGLGASERLEQSHLAETGLGVHHQMSETKRLKASQSPQLKIVRVVIIAPAVAIGKEGFACIISTHESEFQVVAVIELIAQPVAQGGAQTGVIFLLEGDADGSHQFVMPVPQDLPQTGKRL